MIEVRSALVEYQQNPGECAGWERLVTARRGASALVARLPRKETESPVVSDVLQLIREIADAGAHDRAVAPEDLAQAESLARRGWPGVLAAMLLTPAWQWESAPLLLTVPDRLRSAYVEWLFAAPQGFCAGGDAERYAAHVLRRLEELVRWVNRCPGVEAEAEVHAAYVKASAIPLYFSTGSLRRHAELRGRLLTRAFRQPGDTYYGEALPRAGRRLRVGLVNRHFGPQTETYTTLPSFEQLDPERFEVMLFAHQSQETGLEKYCRDHASDFFVLPEEIEGQLSMLRAAALDVVVFGTNVTAVFNEVTRLALHRVAPLQVVNNSSCITSGLPEVDLYVSGTQTEAPGAEQDFCERLGLLPGPTHAFNYAADAQEPREVCTRADFGLPEDALVFVSAANYFKIIPEMQEAWARLLAAVPGSCLLLHPFNPNWSSEYPVRRFRADFEAVLARYGVAPERLAVSTRRFPSRADVKALLALGDVYLDTYPFGGVNSLVDPLELGLPVVAWEGTTFRSRMGAGLLRELELPELIATTAEEYQALALRLARDAAQRQKTAEAIQAKMGRAPLFLDVLAASEAFGDLIETAYDERVTRGAEAFRALRVPIQATGDETSSDELARARAMLCRNPADAAARRVIGRALLEAGRAARATTYLLSALEGQESSAEHWIDAARALKAERKFSEALQATEAGLRLDQTALEGWVLFAQIAHELGSAEIAREAAGVARQLAPEDTRVAAYL